MGYQKVTKKAEHALEYRDHKNKRTPNRKKRNITENYNFVSRYLFSFNFSAAFLHGTTDYLHA